jgi:hypothetical protein
MAVESQFGPLIVLRNGQAAQTVKPVVLQVSQGPCTYDEAWIQRLVFNHPETLPVDEIDGSFGSLVPICMELETREAGSLDALFANHLGLLTIAEFKLWRNPEARREVVGQILDYARVLRRWTYADLQREVSRRLKKPGANAVFELVKAQHPDLEETRFVDNVSRCLKQGRFLLMVIGDGIREGAEAIATYVQEHAGLHFTLGLVQTAVYEVGNGERIVQPRVLARTLIVNRSVVELKSDDMQVLEQAADFEEDMISDRESFYLSFWSELIKTIKLDDAEQTLAKPQRQGNIFFMLPTKGNMWITAYFLQQASKIGVFLGWSRTSAVAREICSRLEQERDAIDRELGISVEWQTDKDGKLTVGAKKDYASLRDPSNRQDELDWFRDAINRFVSVFRPRIARLWRELSTVSE